MSPVRRWLSRVLGRAVGAAGASLLRLSGRRVGIVVVYHGLADASGDPARDLSAAHGARVVEQQLHHLRRWFRVVDAADVVEATASRRRGARFPVAVTFDDDLRSHVERALPLLVRAGVPATFFLGGTSLHGPHEFWWERAQRALAGGEPSAAAAAAALKTMTYEEREAAVGRLDPGPCDPGAGLRESDVRLLQRSGMRIGFHTRRHEVLTALADDAVADALEDGRDELEVLAETRLTLIAYPHGANDARVRELAARAGYRRGFTVAGRPVCAADDRLAIPRIVPSYRSAGGFALQLLAEILGR